jgi:16S rRNA (uracil1498-N3)-methyltransferase
MRRRFFVEKFDDGTAVVRGESAAHLARVLRAERGQLYELSDGERAWVARIAWVNPEAVEFSLVEPVDSPEMACGSSLEITLLLSILKFDRMEWCLEKAAELGATRIIIMAAERSDNNLAQAAGKRAQRWEKILREAAQQSRRMAPPFLGPCEKPEVAFSNSDADLRIMCSEIRGAVPIRKVLKSPKPVKHVALAFGPEGGWTDKEFTAAAGAGFQQAGLGSNILRAETAVIAALAIVRYALGGEDLSS